MKSEISFEPFQHRLIGDPLVSFSYIYTSQNNALSQSYVIQVSYRCIGRVNITYGEKLNAKSDYSITYMCRRELKIAAKLVT